MTFKVKAPETIVATVTMVGQGREQKLEVTFRHMLRSEYMDLLQQIREGHLDAAAAVLRVLSSWDADVPLDADGVGLLQENQPGADWAILMGYGDALGVARKGN